MGSTRVGAVLFLLHMVSSSSSSKCRLSLRILQFTPKKNLMSSFNSVYPSSLAKRNCSYSVTLPASCLTTFKSNIVLARLKSLLCNKMILRFLKLK